MNTNVTESTSSDSQTTGKEVELQLSIKKVKYNSVENIPVLIFFTILKTNEISLLNPENNEVSESELSAIWNNLLEDYYLRTNKKSYTSAISSERELWALRNKLITLVCITLLTGQDNPSVHSEVKSTLKYFGINQNITTVKLDLYIKRERSKLQYLEQQKTNNNKKQEINFWKILAQVEDGLGRQIDTEKTTLAHWIEILNVLKEKKINSLKNSRKNGRR